MAPLLALRGVDGANKKCKSQFAAKRYTVNLLFSNHHCLLLLTVPAPVFANKVDEGGEGSGVRPTFLAKRGRSRWR